MIGNKTGKGQVRTYEDAEAKRAAMKFLEESSCDQISLCFSKRRTKAACAARKLAYRSLKAAGYSPGVIGRVFGRDRSTVIHGLK